MCTAQDSDSSGAGLDLVMVICRQRSAHTSTLSITCLGRSRSLGPQAAAVAAGCMRCRWGEGSLGSVTLAVDALQWLGLVGPGEVGRDLLPGGSCRRCESAASPPCLGMRVVFARDVSGQPHLPGLGVVPPRAGKLGWLRLRGDRGSRGGPEGAWLRMGLVSK